MDYENRWLSPFLPLNVLDTLYLQLVLGLGILSRFLVPNPYLLPYISSRAVQIAGSLNHSLLACMCNEYQHLMNWLI